MIEKLQLLVTIALLAVLAAIAAPHLAHCQQFNLQCQSCTEQPILTPSATPTTTLTPTPIPPTISPTLTPTAAPTNTVSPVCASIPPQTQLQDSASNVYTVVGGNVLVNGSSDAGGSSVALLVYDGAHLWAQSSTIWFTQSAANASWQTTGTTGPACLNGSPTPAPTSTGSPSPTPLAQACFTLNLCGFDGAGVYETMQVQPPSTSPTGGDCCLYATPGDKTSQCVECNPTNLAATNTYNEKQLSLAYCATHAGLHGCP